MAIQSIKIIYNNSNPIAVYIDDKLISTGQIDIMKILSILGFHGTEVLVQDFDGSDSPDIPEAFDGLKPYVQSERGF